MFHADISGAKLAIPTGNSVAIDHMKEIPVAVGRMIKTAYLEIFESETTHLANYTIVAEYIDGGILRDKPSANRLQLTEEIVCEQVVNRSIAVVIYAPLLQRETQPEYLSRVSSTAYALGFYSIPTIGVMVREAEFSKKKIYPTFVRPTPAYADESYVFLKLLQRLDYRQ
ncbi:hypothetical protein TELCIR_14825, partial [Teladorsagia circumcincta]